MNRFRKMMKDHAFIRGSSFILFNAVILCVLYFVVKNFGWLSGKFLYGLSVLIDAFWPLVIGLIIAYLLNPLSELIDRKLMRRFFRLPDDPMKAEKKRSRHHFISVILTLLLVFAVVVAIICGFTVMIMGKVEFENVPALAQNLMDALVNYSTVVENWITQHLPQGIVSGKLQELTTSVMDWFMNNFDASSIIKTCTNIGGSIADVVIGIIISIYLMKDKEFFLGLWRKFLHLILPQKANAVFTEALHEVNLVFSKFIRGALLDAIIVAFLSSIGLSIMKLDAAVFIGVFAGIANVIPYFGPIIGMIPAFFMGLATGGFWHGVLAVIILFAVQQIDCNLIYPKVVGSTTGLHPLVVLLAVSVFGYFGGILGMLLAVPLAGVIQVFVIKWAQSRERYLANAEEAAGSADDASPDAPPEEQTAPPDAN